MKTFIKIASLLTLVVLPLFISGCENKGDKDAVNNTSSVSSFDFLLDYGKYIGMSKSNVQADLNSQNWTFVKNSSGHDEYSLPVAGYTAELRVYYDKDAKGSNIDVEVNNMSNAMEVAGHLHNAIGETYTLTTIGQTLTFAGGSIILEEDDELNRPKIKSYEEGKTAYSNTSYVGVGTEWEAKVSSITYGLLLYADREEEVLYFNIGM